MPAPSKPSRFASGRTWMFGIAVGDRSDRMIDREMD
jgi:hypothetical protein